MARSTKIKLTKDKKQLDKEVDDFYDLLGKAESSETQRFSTSKNLEALSEKEQEELEDFHNADGKEDQEWLSSDFEGQLSVDVYQTADKIVIKSAIAGVKPEDIDISVTNDMVTIRGRREDKHTPEGAEYLFKECFWGNFSRSIILPTEIETDNIEAVMKNGILTIILPKSKSSKNVIIKVKGED